jgi:ribosome biogenesis GTPase
MKKRPRKRKRSTRPSSGQVRQRLSRLSREVHGDAVDEIDIELVELSRQKGSATEEGGSGGAPAGTPPPIRDSRHGTVVGLSSGACEVDCGDEQHRCVLPSRLAAEQRSKLAVGDEVTFVAHGAGHRLAEVLPRRTVLSRPDPQNPRRERVIAANADVVSIVVSVKNPVLRPALIDRYMIATERGGARTVLVVNKVDLLHRSSGELEILRNYVEMGVPVLRCSALDGTGMAELRAALAGCTTVFVGHSGVGKSSLLNALDPSLGLATSEVDRRYARGRHTTTRARLFHLDGGIRLIDTPGIRELGLWKLDAEELRFFFPDFSEIAAGCRFSDCSHVHEPGCAIRAAAADGTLDRARYATYQRIHEALEAERQRF